MLRKSHTRAMKALLGSTILLALPLATGCQTGNFGGNIPGYGMISGWWGGADASKADPSKPPAGYLPSSKADPNGQSYAGGANRGARRGVDVDYGGEAGGYGAQGSSYAAGNRNNLNNWEAGKRNPGSSYGAGGADAEGEFAGAPSYGKSAGYGTGARGEKATPGYDPYGGATPSTGEDEYGASPRGSAHTADARGATSGPRGGYSTRMASGSQRASKSTPVEDEGYEAEEPAPTTGGSRFSSRDDVSAPRGSRSAKVADEDDGAMTADEDAEASYPQTKGYGSGYKVPSTRSSSAPSSERRYPSTKSGGASSRTTDDDYGMSETEATGEEEATVEKVAATEPTRYGLSSKAAAMLDRGLDGDFRPGSTSRPGYRTAAKVSQAGYSAEETEEESTEVGRTASRFAE